MDGMQLTLSSYIATYISYNSIQCNLEHTMGKPMTGWYPSTYDRYPWSFVPMGWLVGMGTTWVGVRVGPLVPRGLPMQTDANMRISDKTFPMLSMYYLSSTGETIEWTVITWSWSHCVSLVAGCHHWLMH